MSDGPPVLASLAIAIAITVSLALGCTSAKVTSQYEGSDLSKPDRVLVYDFATSADKVKLDRGPSAKVAEAAKSGLVSDQERAVGQKVANALPNKIVTELKPFFEWQEWIQ